MTGRKQSKKQAEEIAKEIARSERITQPRHILLNFYPARCRRGSRGRSAGGFVTPDGTVETL
jgi:hypothetical protein